MTYTSIISNFLFFFNAAEKFLRSPSECVAEGGGWGEEFRHARAFRRAKRGGYVKLRFLDLCIRFGKIISKVCKRFNSAAKSDDTNSKFSDDDVRSPSPATSGAGLAFAGGFSRALGCFRHRANNFPL